METYFIKEKKERNYTVLDNTFIKDDTLSWKAKGIMTYLLSLPDDWKIYISEIAKHSSDGECALRSAINELIEHGYIKREKKRDEKGLFTETIYKIIENPCVENPHLENPHMDNRTLQNTNCTKYENKQSTDNIPPKRKNKKSELFDMIVSFTENETLRKLLSSWLKERLQDSRMSKESLELNLSMLKQYGNGDEQKMINKVSERLAAGHRALIYSNDLKEKNNVHKDRQTQYSMAYDDTVAHDYSAKNNITRDENGEIVEIGF